MEDKIQKDNIYEYIEQGEKKYFSLDEDIFNSAKNAIDKEKKKDFEMPNNKNLIIFKKRDDYHLINKHTKEILFEFINLFCFSWEGLYI